MRWIQRLKMFTRRQLQNSYRCCISSHHSTTIYRNGAAPNHLVTFMMVTNVGYLQFQRRCPQDAPPTAHLLGRGYRSPDRDGPPPSVQGRLTPTDLCDLVQRAHDLTDDAGGHLGVACCGVELGMSEQNLDHTNI